MNKTSKKKLTNVGKISKNRTVITVCSDCMVSVLRSSWADSASLVGMDYRCSPRAFEPTLPLDDITGNCSSASRTSSPKDVLKACTPRSPT
eukprot:4910712-Amphidinium_carterae.1